MAHPLIFSRAIADWQTSHSKTLKPATFENYAGTLRQFGLYVADADPRSDSTETLLDNR